MDETEIRVERRAGMTIERRASISCDAVLDALGALGDVLKASHKMETRRVGEWVVKSSARSAGAMVKHTFQRGKCRRAWDAALYLERKGVSVPRAVAYVEHGRFGLVFGYGIVSEYLEESVDVEAYADRLIADRVSDADIHAYLGRLAHAVNGLCASGAFHNDLAGKNILTRDGETFYFIDLDGIVLDCAYTDALRMRNHVQLYDSFLDRLDDAFLEPFVKGMLADGADATGWMDEVRREQTSRRERTEAIWREQGKIDRVGRGDNMHKRTEDGS